MKKKMEKKVDQTIKLSQGHLELLVRYTQERDQAIVLAETNNYRWKGYMGDLSELYSFPFNSKTKFNLSQEGLTIIQEQEEE